MPEPSQIARNRGLQSIAVWGEFNIDFTVGKLTHAIHTADVDLITTHTTERDTAKDDFDLAVSNRDTNITTLADLNIRVPHVIESSLEEESQLFNQFAEIYAIAGDSADDKQKRAGKVISLWKLYNTERAAQSPPLGELAVSDLAVTDMEDLLVNHPELIKGANDKKAIWTKKKSQLRITTTRVDKNNKRWFEAWDNNYAEGTPESDALNDIDTEGGGADPVEQAVIDAASPMGGLVVDLHFHADHATSYRIMQRVVGTATWLLVVENLEADTWTGTVSSTGQHEFQVFGKNSIGEGDGSAPVTVTVS